MCQPGSRALILALCLNGIVGVTRNFMSSPELPGKPWPLLDSFVQTKISPSFLG